MSFLRNGCTMMGWPNYIQEIIIGPSSSSPWPSTACAIRTSRARRAGVRKGLLRPSSKRTRRSQEDEHDRQDRQDVGPIRRRGPLRRGPSWFPHRRPRSLSAGRPGGRGPAGPGSSGDRPDPEQVQAIEKFRQGRREDRLAFRGEMDKLRNEMRALRRDPRPTGPGSTRSSTRGQASAERQKRAFRTRAERDKILTPEQREKLRAFRPHPGRPASPHPAVPTGRMPVPLASPPSLALVALSGWGHVPR